MTFREIDILLADIIRISTCWQINIIWISIWQKEYLSPKMSLTVPTVQEISIVGKEKYTIPFKYFQIFI
jgi:hypothetical protein